MVPLFQLFTVLGILDFSQALPAYLPVYNSSSSTNFSTPTTFTTFMPTAFPSIPVPHNTSIAAPPLLNSTTIISHPSQNTSLTLSPTLSTARGILVVTTTVDRHHFVEVAPVTVITVQKVTETEVQKVTESQMQMVTETQIQKVTETQMQKVTETKMVTVTESGATGTEGAVGSTIILLPLPSSSTTMEVATTMTTIAIVTTDVTSVLTAILTHTSTDLADATTTEQPTSQNPVSSSARSAPVPTTTEATSVAPTSTIESAPVITPTPGPTTEVDSGLRSSTLLRISISRLSPPPEPAFVTVAPVVTEAPVVTPPPVTSGDNSETERVPDWDDIKRFPSTFVDS